MEGYVEFCFSEPVPLPLKIWWLSIWWLDVRLQELLPDQIVDKISGDEMALSFEERLNLGLVPSLMFDPVRGRQFLLSSLLTRSHLPSNFWFQIPTVPLLNFRPHISSGALAVLPLLTNQRCPCRISALIFPTVSLLNFVFIRNR
jgi:hypothetical protein